MAAGGGGKLREANPLGHWSWGVVRGRGDAGGIRRAGEQPGGRDLEGLGKECGFHPECTEGSRWRVFCKEVGMIYVKRKKPLWLFSRFHVSLK